MNLKIIFEIFFDSCRHFLFDIGRREYCKALAEGQKQLYKFKIRYARDGNDSRTVGVRLDNGLGRMQRFGKRWMNLMMNFLDIHMTIV